MRVLHWTLRLSTFALLLGHGALGILTRKALLAAHYSSIGLPGAAVEPWVGGFEMLLAVAVLAKPSVGLLVFVFAWKLATEVLNPIAGSLFWVFVEHGGSYAAPLALAYFQLSCRPDQARTEGLPAADAFRSGLNDPSGTSQIGCEGCG